MTTPKYEYATTSGRAGWLDTGTMGMRVFGVVHASTPAPPDKRRWELVAVTQGGGVINWTWRREVPKPRVRKERK